MKKRFALAMLFVMMAVVLSGCVDNVTVGKDVWYDLDSGVLYVPTDIGFSQLGGAAGGIMNDQMKSICLYYATGEQGIDIMYDSSKTRADYTEENGIYCIGVEGLKLLDGGKLIQPRESMTANQYAQAGGKVQYTKTKPSEEEGSPVKEDIDVSPILLAEIPLQEGDEITFRVGVEVMNSSYTWSDTQTYTVVPGQWNGPLPETGDSTNLMLLGGMLMISVIGMTAVVRKARKSH